MDIYEACSELNASFFLRFKKLLPEGLTNLETNQPTTGTVEEIPETQISQQTIGSTSSIGLSEVGTNTTQDDTPEPMENSESNTAESSDMTMTNSSGSSNQPTEPGQ